MKRSIQAAAAVLSATMLTTAAFAQTSIPATSGATAPTSAPSITPAKLHIPEGTELTIRFEDDISSASSSVGDRFTISSPDSIDVAGGESLPAGLKGVGEVTSVRKKGMMGQAGDLTVRFDYLKFGTSRVNLRGSKGGSGNGSVGATVALTVLFGPLGLLKHGHDMVIHKGQTVKAYVDQDVDIALPSTVPAVGTATASAHS